jgi:hypothetical protein
MATPNTPMNLSSKAQLGILEYSRQAYQMLNTQWSLREQMRVVDLAYIRETDFTKENARAKTANRYGDANKFQNITVPVVMPAVEAAVAYQASVFLTGTPIFGVVSEPKMEDEAIQMESVIADQSIRGGWVREFMMFFRDGFKYNLSAVEVTWDRTVTATLDTDLSFSTTQAKPKEVIWQGNKIERLDLYNTFWDARVTPAKVYCDGEFAGYTKMMSRTRLKQFINELPVKILDNIKAAFESGIGTGVNSTGGIESYYIPQINPSAILNKNPKATTDWLAWANVTGASSDIKIAYKNMYEVTTLYARILPADFGLIVPASNTPQVWKFIIVNHSVIIYAERQTNAHGWLPILFGQPLEDGLGYQTKSLATNVQPIQEFTSAMSNSVIQARRRAISDRTIYDPSRISEQHINSENPSAKIPVRPAAYGKNVMEAVHAFPFRDDQSGTILQEIPQYIQMGNMLSGQNQAKQGQFVKGNKTLHEYQSVMSNANGRDQMVSMLYESQVFTPLKEIIKINILQYQGGTSIYNRDKQAVVKIDPVALRKSILEFKVSDGIAPTDKIINSDTMQVALQVFGSSPAISSEYNVAQFFSYLMKTQGAHITPFEKSPEQKAYENALMQWQQMAQSIGAGLKGADPATVQAAMKSLPPQPTPEQYGYDPKTGGGVDSSQQQQPKVNNITNNITTQQTKTSVEAP